MRRSKIFLGVTTSLLGVAAFATSKAKWNGVPTAYITDVDRIVCIRVSQLGTVIPESQRLRTLTWNDQPTLLFTNAIIGVCEHPAYFKAE